MTFKKLEFKLLIRYQINATHRRCTSFCECRDSPSISPVSSTTAAPVSSQLVSIPRTSLDNGAFPEHQRVCLNCSSLCTIFTCVGNMVVNVMSPHGELKYK